MIEFVLGLAGWQIALIWAFGTGLMFLAGIMFGWIERVSGAEVLFRIGMWPVFILLLIVVGFFKTIQTLWRR